MNGYQSAREGQLTQAAFELVKAINQVTDENLPGKLAGIVKIHAGIGVGCIFIPVPGADLFAAFGNTWTMYVRINKELNLPFTKNLVKSIATGILSNLASNAAILAVFGLGSALKFLPGPGTVASYALMSATVYAATIAAGYIYMKALAALLQNRGAGQVKEEDLKAAVARVMNDKETVQSIFNTAKENYTKADSDLSSLALELGDLKQKMQQNAVTSEQINAVREIAAAEIAAQQNDTPKTFKRLKNSGEWALENADKFELNLAAAALRMVLGQ
ncbi:hypothetical protein [Scytonema sp. NUACC26]|uniref:hypothetical protein n=1 Tax=Scytonema sp. NUACC26 TaxID=3140176 RepID=UPI0034DBCB80